ncbi:FecR family protein [Pedobacter sp. V48]|uniref:FecR family protein n=1 Tax=Pedobacter sp. V48 TaxID=509635 RepID=UPI0003E474C8|nr:FecR family protein [Pedobacter sp. V48]ETZ20202.1 hypothetical protein N824_08290 [Pedobacter sp. V48]
MTKSRFRYLYDQYLNGKLSADEQEEWSAALSDSDFYDELEILTQHLWDRDDLPVPDYNKEKARVIYEDIIGLQNEKTIPLVIKPGNQKTVKLWPRLASAAIAVLVLSVGIFFYHKRSISAEQKNNYAQDAAPGKVGATLTLANGKKISLSKTGKGEVAKESGVSIRKTSEGQLVYQLTSSSRTGGKNTLTTARGETYILILPDHSKVWLNAASSITYSADLLKDGIRRVELEGEAYFEIAKDKKHPFVVSTPNHDVEVLGTHFNISSYANESTTTTLLEGSVKVKNGQLSRTLKPNQQSKFVSGVFDVKNVIAEDAIAWKDGIFLFEDEPLQSIMKRISRWYNVDVEYEKGVDKNKLYGGGLSKYNQVSSVLEMLESTKNIHFKIEGRRIIVMK